MVKAAIYQIEKLNPKEIPVFLSHLSTANDPENFNRKHNLFILKDLVRIQGRNIIPYINQIMSALIQSLQFSHNHSNFAFHGTCSQLVLQIAEYGIDPTGPECENIKFVTSLCKPLSDFLMSSQKNVASVCAFCIRAIVESNIWKYASSELVNHICLEVVGALQEEVDPTRTGTHLRLAISLAKQSPLVLEPYGKSLIKLGLFFLIDGGPQSKLLSLEMIRSIVKCVGMSAISSEIGNVINVLQTFANDSLLVMSVAVEVLETIKNVKARRRVVLGNSLSPVTGLGSREHHPMEVMIVESNSDVGRIGGCMMCDQCDKCMFEKSSNQLYQRIKPHNSVDNLRALLSSPQCSYSTTDQKLQNQSFLSPNYIQSQVPLNSPEAKHKKILQGIGSETAMERVGCGNLDGTHMPSCEPCNREEKGFRVVDLISGCLDFILRYVFGEK